MPTRASSPEPVTFPSQELQFQQRQQERLSRRPQRWRRRQEQPGRVAGSPRRLKASRGGLGLSWWWCMPFLFFLSFFFFNSVALMEANQRESPLPRVDAARRSWEGCSAYKLGSGWARGSGCAGGAAAAAQNPRRFPGSLGAAPPPSGKT